MMSAAAVAGVSHHACTNQGTVKRLGSTAQGEDAKYIGVLSLTHTRERASSDENGRDLMIIH